MNKLISATTTIAATALALLSGAAPASAQTAPNALLTTNMRTVANEFGDQYGHLSITNATGGTQVLAYGQRGFVIYTAGDSISSGDTAAFCSYNAAAGLSSCVPLGLSAGGSTGYVCEYYPGDGWCDCTVGEDCMRLVNSGACTGELDCENGSCSCINW
ncbi:MAG: hypothetical protein ABI134_34290 [Byssovorax sp.]